MYAGFAFSNEGHPHKEPKPSSELHEHQAPHSGKMAALGSYYVEMVVEAGSIVKVFVYDSEDKPVPVKGISGQIHITFPDNHRETLGLEPATDQSYLSAHMKDQGHPSFKAVLSLIINGQRHNIRLNL
jgi:nitrogen fixation protein FixH